MKFLCNTLNRLKEFQTLDNAVQTGQLPAAVNGLSGVHKAAFIYTLCANQHRKAFILAGDESEGQRLCDDLSAMGMHPLVVPMRDFTFRDAEGASHEYEHQRLQALARILNGECDAVIACLDAALQYTIPPEELRKRTITISAGQSIPMEEVVSALVACGYERAAQIDGTGQFSQRGGILDIFTPDAANPVRLEYWGDEIDTLSLFDLETQRRTESIEKLTLAPAVEALVDDPQVLAKKIEKLASSLRGKAAPKAKEILRAQAEKLEQGVHLGCADKFFPLLYGRIATLFDYRTDDMLLFVSEGTKVKDRARSTAFQWGEDLKDYLEEGVPLPWAGHLQRRLDLRGGAIFARYGLSGYLCARQLRHAHPHAHRRNRAPALCVGRQHAAPGRGPAEHAPQQVVLRGIGRKRAERAHRCGGPASRRPARGLPGKPADHPARHGRRDRRRALRRYGNSRRLFRADHPRPPAHHQAAQAQARQKQPGDLQHRGIAAGRLYCTRFARHRRVRGNPQNRHARGCQGTQRSTVAKGDMLYVPVTQLDMVSKYIGPREDANIKLNRLGGTEWQKTKARVRTAVKDMAKELIKLYADRMQAKGHAFSEDNEWQRDFESHFEFDETEDQLRCIDEIKNDMEREAPMDRLLCGDVGFGKTEVALRAAFKCVCDSKQCALLVPTTILAWQHYQTVTRRMEGFPVRVELLSRFRTPKQQEEIIRKLKRGEVDMIVGTHRLVSKDVKFKDLGLVIIDEEQRFGVAQKEKLKSLCNNVDVLTLSATPIPRTLNMALSGIRDMSVIEEAPHDRHPVQTYVLEHDNAVINEAIRRELRRGGQVYYLHNDVASIERTAARIQAQIPEARVGFGHGKMAEHELSEVWRKLLEHEIDVLVCTTIIETGVDVPNANTLIIENADRMGLSQLHQLRGRVGRSARRAYAYLTFTPNKVLSEISQKRLSAIREFTEFGSGFKIAMRDLEIRGAGNILGGEQHGHMETVGYDMYLRLLSEAIRREKGEEVQEYGQECLVDMQIQAHIPDRYIENLSQRLEIYRRIADIRTREDALDVTDELIDRFGEPPESVNGLIEVALLRNLASGLGISEVKQRDDCLLLYKPGFSLKNPADMAQMAALTSTLKKRVTLNASGKPYISVKILPPMTPLDVLGETLNLMEDTRKSVKK